MCGIQYTFKNIISIIPGGGRRAKSPFEEVHKRSTAAWGLSQEALAAQVSPSSRVQASL